MATVCYVGVEGLAKKVKKIYVGVDNKAKKVNTVFVGNSDNNSKLSLHTHKYGINQITPNDDSFTHDIIMKCSLCNYIITYTNQACTADSTTYEKLSSSSSNYSTYHYKKQYCEACDRTYKTLQLHTFNTVTTAPTCGESGSETKTCTKCGYTESSVSPPTGLHQLGSTTYYDVEGNPYKICTVCGENVKV